MKTLQISLCFLLGLSSSLLHGQSHWLTVQQNDVNVQLINTVDNEVVMQSNMTSPLINYNPTIKVYDILRLPLFKDNPQTNIFTVHHPGASSRENLIWSLNKQAENKLLFTDQRVADLTSGKFMNFPSVIPHQPQISSYFHSSGKHKIDNLSIGDTPNNSEIPVDAFSGSIGELLVFDQVLSPNSRQMVESNLAIKYSIPMTNGVSYIGKGGKVLWDATQPTYRHDIAGLGRLDELKLYQKQSKSAFGKGNIIIAINNIKYNNQLNEAVLINDSYLLWADNGAPILFSKDKYGISTLERNWILENRGIYNQSYELNLDHSRLVSDLKDEVLWLAIDTLGNGLTSTTYHRMKYENDVMKVFDLEVGTNTSILSIQKSVGFWAALEIEEPDCSNNDTGQLLIKPLGGKAPYQIKIEGEAKSLVFNNINQGDYVNTSINPGGKTLFIEDANGNTWTQSIYINSHNIPDLLIDHYYELDNHLHIIDASLQMQEGLEYTWTPPSGEIINTAQINFEQSGIYTLQISNGTCINQYQIEVTISAPLIEEYKISPNPSIGGYCQIEATFNKAVPYELTVYTSAGITISQEAFARSKYVNQPLWLDPGVYFIALKTGQQVQTRKQIVIEN